MEWKELMQTRQSCREYLDGQITTAQLKDILQAGCAAPVARGKFEQLRLRLFGPAGRQDPALAAEYV